MALEVGADGKMYWIKRTLINGGKIKADADCFEDDSAAEFIGGPTVPYECATRLKDAGRLYQQDKLWYGVELPDVSTDRLWVCEDDVKLQSPYDWPGFRVVKEEQEDEVPLLLRLDGLFHPTDDRKVDTQNLPPFFQRVFKIIDTNDDGTSTRTNSKPP